MQVCSLTNTSTALPVYLPTCARVAFRRSPPHDWPSSLRRLFEFRKSNSVSVLLSLSHHNVNGALKNVSAYCSLSFGTYLLLTSSRGNHRYLHNVGTSTSASSLLPYQVLNHNLMRFYVATVKSRDTYYTTATP